MKRIILACACALSLTALADQPNRGGVDATDVDRRIDRGAAEVKKDARNLGHEVKTNADELGRQAGLATEEQGTFKADRAYELSGVTRKLTLGHLTIDRSGLPPATLSIRDRTVVKLDGREIDAKQIPEGAPVRAKFQLEGNATVAVEIDAHLPVKK